MAAYSLKFVYCYENLCLLSSIIYPNVTTGHEIFFFFKIILGFNEKEKDRVIWGIEMSVISKRVILLL